MARPKRQYGSGCLIEQKGGFLIRWREPVIAPDGTTKKVLCSETLRGVSKRHAERILGQKIAASESMTVARSQVTFQTVSDQWLKTVLPMYKPSTQKNHRHIVAKHLIPRFGEQPMSAITRQSVQAYVAHLAQAGYAPKTVDHIHDVLSAILRTAVGWGHLADNNVLRRWVYPACVTLGLPKVSWNVFRRTYSTWAHEKGVPAKIVARIVGHTKVDTTLNVYTQVIEDSVRTAVQGVGEELFRIVQWPVGTSGLTH